MTLDQLFQIIMAITLIEMMVAIGLGVTFSQLYAVTTNWRLVVSALVANYVCVPAAAVGLLLLFQAPPAVTAGLLILAVCPGAPYGPPFTTIARGNIAAAVGLMVLLAGSSAVIAPLLLGFLLPLMTGSELLQINSARMVGTLLVTQLLPLCAGLCIRHWWPNLADKLERPAEVVSKFLNLFAAGLILFAQFQTLAGIRPMAFVGMLALLLVSLAAGWLAGAPGADGRRAMTLMTSLRNVAVSLVIGTSAFPGTPVVTTVLAYALIEISGSLLLAIWWGRRPAAGISA
jgi:BASS family bile acid:Na+ symporter